MRHSDRILFQQAARDLTLWILVRRTNPASLAYVGKAGYTPKPIDCKAKTADLDFGGYRLAGLVADPTRVPAAFKPGKLEKAVKIWHEMAAEHHIGDGRFSSPYRVDLNSQSPHHGCLMLDGKYLHGDYDLYDIIDPAHPSANLAAIETLRGVPHMRGPRLGEVQRYINERIRSDMIQHGGEMQYTDHTEQSIDVFGPNGEECTILNEYSVRAWYEGRFGGRRAISLKG